MAQCSIITLNLPDHTLSTSCFATLFAVITLEEDEERRITKPGFGWLPLCYFSFTGGRYWPSRSLGQYLTLPPSRVIAV